ncbi:MAG: cupin domain-containing protein [Candidatus Bipolaricaulota bacterium]
MKIQHLVLDSDVHKALKARKKKIGVTVKEIGNSALRAALSIPNKEELIVEKLVETGKITHKDYDEATAAANKALKDAQKRAVEAVAHNTARQTLTIGSWEGRELYRSPDNQVQVFDHWARDAKKTPTPEIVHEESRVWAIVISGEVRMRIDGEEEVFGPHQVIHIQPGMPHASTPLTRTTRVILVLMPALSLER